MSVDTKLQQVKQQEAKSKQIKQGARTYITLRRILALFILIGIFYIAWQKWPQLQIMSIHWQGEINRHLSDLVYQIKSHQNQAAWSLIGLSFLYGALHALGPGHGKVIVATYLATHPTKVNISLYLTCISALMQALVAISLVSILSWVFHASMKEVNAHADLWIKFSFICMFALGCLMLYRTLKALYFQKKSHANHHHKSSQHPSASHQSCGCHHQHTVQASQINQATHWTDYLAIVVSIGVRPCTGAIMVLLFSSAAQMYWVGLLSALFMSVGTAISTSCVALLTLSGKRFLQGNPSYAGYISYLGLYLQLLAAIFITAMAVVFYLGSSAGLSPVLVGSN